MSEKYVSEDNLKNILNCIQGKIPKELEVNVNTNINRVKVDILDNPVVVYQYGSFTEKNVVFGKDLADFDLIEIDVKYAMSSGSTYFETHYISKESLINSAIPSTSSPSQFCTTINSTNAAAGDVSSSISTLRFYFKATIVSYTDKPNELKFMCSIGSIGSASGTTITILAARGVTYTQSYGDTPIGTIISYIGITPPDEYLACDGTTYLINQYWELAEFIKSQFGSYNYFGGNGTTTFAVPDLRGEFLRGTGTNSRTRQGSGSAVGVHQDATDFPQIGIIGNTLTARGNDYLAGASSSYFSANRDTFSWGNDGTTGGIGKSSTTSAATISDSSVTSYTSRPTNTSVLYCIKYTNSSTMQPSNVYSTEEKRIGTWIDGKPLYQITVQFTTPSSSGPQPYSFLPSVPFSVIDTLVNVDGFTMRADNWYVQINSYDGNCFFNFNKINSQIYFILSTSAGTATTSKLAIMTFRYTKTTD